MKTEERNGYKIVDHRGQSIGKPKAMSGLYSTPSNSGQQDYYRPRPIGATDVRSRVTDCDWRELLEYSRQLFAQLGNLAAAIIQKNIYAIGDAWQPQYGGEDVAWGEEAEEWLRELFYPVACVRGEPYDFVTSLLVDGIAMDVDGDSVMIFTESVSGFPQIKFIPAHRIGSRGYFNEVKGGPFDGAKIYNGVIVNRDGRPIGYRILGDDPKDDYDVSTYNAQMNYEPEWAHQGRGIPRPSRGLLDWFDVQDIDTFLKRGVKLDSAQGLLHFNEDGSADAASDAIEDRAAGEELQDVKIERRLGGEVMYFKARSGERIEPFKSERPHPNVEAFVNRIERRGILCVGWFYELIDPSKIGGASVRMIQDQARINVKTRQKTIRRRAKRAIQYAIAKGMKTGWLRRNETDWWKWNFDLPALLTVDAGYDEQADRENMAVGSSTLSEVCGKRGKHWEDVRQQKGREAHDLLTRAMALVEEFKGLTLEGAINLLSRQSANPPPLIKDEDQNAKPGGGVDRDGDGITNE